MKEMKRILLELEGAWKALEAYAEHAPNCSVLWGPGGPCDCGLSAARTRLRAAAYQLLTRYAVHDAGCPALRGASCDCGLDSARSRLHALAQT